MQTNVTADPNADLPPTRWSKILTATPVVLTVIATLLAGLASGEMTKAQYDRSSAAQLQSKAGDQWGFFQAKRLRGSLQLSTLEILQSNADIQPVTADALHALGTLPGDDATLALILRDELPPGGTVVAPDPQVANALAAVDQALPESELSHVLAALDERILATALHDAQERARAFDAATRPETKLIDQIDAQLNAHRTEQPVLSRNFAAVRLRYTALRYEAEARLNQAVAGLLELQVRKGNLSAERHHVRSQRFFYGMLAAQAGVVLSTFAMAARRRNFLWSVAASAGLGAISFALYVFLFV